MGMLKGQKSVRCGEELCIKESKRVIGNEVRELGKGQITQSLGPGKEAEVYSQGKGKPLGESTMI